MFELRLMVDDKKLTGVLWALDGKIVGQPVILPVRGAAVKGGKLISSTTAPGNSLCAQVSTFLATKKIKWLTDPILVEAIEAAGGKPSSKQYVIQCLQKAGRLSTRSQQGKDAGKFKVLTPKKGKVTRG